MKPLKTLAETASELRAPLSLVLKSELGREVLRNTSAVPGLVLQGGGAVRHVFGSPRYSADLDFAQQPDLDEERVGAALSAAAAEAGKARGELRDVLPRPHLDGFDSMRVIREVKALYDALLP